MVASDKPETEIVATNDTNEVVYDFTEVKKVEGTRGDRRDDLRRSKGLNPNKRGKPFSNVKILDYDEETDKVTYLHHTKGKVTRKVTPYLMSQLVTNSK